MTELPAVQGIPFEQLAAEFGTPLYVYDGNVLAAQYRGLRDVLHPALEMFFSLKANPNLSVCAMLRSFGACAEVSSLIELRTALEAGVAPENVIFLGPGKSHAELAACLDHDIAAIVCESFEELACIDELAEKRGVVARVALRINPGFSVKGARLTMGGKARQFGIDEEQVLARPDLASAHANIRLVGVHAYLGTRILDAAVIGENTRRILDLAQRLAILWGTSLELVDIGGGLGVAYFENETDLDPEAVAAQVNPAIEAFRSGHPGARLIMELGRYLTAPAGVYVSRVRYIKESVGERFAVTDGGTHHHMAAVGVGSPVKRNFPMRLLNRVTADSAESWQVTGPLCTPNDTLGRNIMLPPLQTGDLIGVLRSGAYGPTASPVQFLSHGYPAEVLVHDGRAHLVRDRDLPEDLLRGQHLVPGLTDPVGVS